MGLHLPGAAVCVQLYNMMYVADTNTFLAVALGEPERDWLLNVTRHSRLLAPVVLPFEIGNALSAMVKRRALRADQVSDVWETVAKIPVELTEFDVRSALRLAVRSGIYAYDAYYLQCALEARCPLLTLDQKLRHTAQALGMEVEMP